MEHMLDESDGVIDRASRYKKTCVYFSERHYRDAEAAFRRHQLMGIPVVIIGAVVTTSIFATLNTSPAIGWKICAGALSLVGAILSALQTFLKFSDKASEHKAAAANYRALGRKVDIFLLQYKGTPRPEDPLAFTSALNQLERIAETLSELGGQAPHVTRTPYDESDMERSDRIP